MSSSVQMPAAAVSHTAPPAIVCEDLAVGYGGIPVVSAVNLRIGRGAFLPFIGPNGAGKTTLLRAILGLLRPLAGTLTTPFRQSPPGYVSQQKTIDPLYPVSALDIVTMGTYGRRGWRGRPSQADRDAVWHLLERLDLAHHAHKTFGEMSGGMRQKVMIARALASDPAVIVMDEPTTELDEPSQEAVVRHLHHAAVHEGRTVLLAHHGVDGIAPLARDVCLVDHGHARIVPCDSARF